MGKSRLEAFSDGVIAIIITIMVLELKAPKGADVAALHEVLPTFLSYVLSFVFVGIYWNNHHHLLHAVKKVNGTVLWANTHLLFWLSLIPFATNWMGDNHFAATPVALYGLLLFLCALAYALLARVLIVLHGKESALAMAIGRDRKGLLSLGIYLCAVAAAFIDARISMALYVLVAILWTVPDSRIEKAIAE